MSKSHVMVDLETLGSTPGCAILSIGAVKFNPLSDDYGPEFYVNVDLQSCLNVGLAVEGPAFYWWMQQSEQARNALSVLLTPLYIALAQFRNYLGEECFLWSHGTSFDIPVLACAYAKMGMEKPWAFRDERDTRTVLSLADMRIPKIEGAHHALEDAKNQAVTISKAMRLLKGI